MIRIEHPEHGFHNVLQSELQAHLERGWMVWVEHKEEPAEQPAGVTDIRRQKLGLPGKKAQ